MMTILFVIGFWERNSIFCAIFDDHLKYEITIWEVEGKETKDSGYNLLKD